MDEQQEPDWQPISTLPIFADMISQALADARDMHVNLQKGIDMPHVFDTATIDRINTLYTEVLFFAGLYEQQLDRWTRETLKPDEKRQIDRLWTLLPELRKMAEAVLKIAAQIRNGTIDRIMEMDDLDLELGLRALSGKGFNHR